MTYKPFDQQLFDDNDAAAKNRVASFLIKNGYSVNEGTKYGIDLVVEKAGIGTIMVEVEVKHNWKGESFPFPTVHFLYRKKKFFEQPQRVYMALLNSQMTHAMLVENKTILKGKLVTKDTIYTAGERFYEVRVTDCPIVRL